MRNSDRLQAQSVVLQDERLQAELLVGGTVSLPLQKLRALDFSRGKIRYLSEMEPENVKYTPFFDVVWEYQRDRNLDGRPLRVGNEEYDKGLSVHSRTRLVYRLGGDYGRLRTVVGIDHNIEGYELGHVHVVIRGDGEPIWEADVRGTDPPRPIDLDVSGVRELEILVDFGSNLDIADHLDLAQARLIK